jgi:hypothetical protein
MTDPTTAAPTETLPITSGGSISHARHAILACGLSCVECHRTLREGWNRYHSLGESGDLCLSCASRRIQEKLGLVFVNSGGGDGRRSATRREP